MATIEIKDDGLIIRLSFGEKLMALHRDIFIPVTSLRGAQVAPSEWQRSLGLRIPGTAIPGLVVYGTYIWSKHDFVAWRRGQQALQLNLSGKPFTHIYLGTDDAAALAAEINEALTAC